MFALVAMTEDKLLVEIDKVNPAPASHPLPASPFSSQTVVTEQGYKCKQAGKGYLVQIQVLPSYFKDPSATAVFQSTRLF